MAIRVNISLPEELHERMQAVKHLMPSISKICQEAIEVKVYRAEYKQTIPNKEEVIQRLRVEKKQYDDEIKSQGIRAGWEHFKTLEYGDIQAIVQGERPDWFDDHEEDIRNEYKERADLFGEGWIEGVKQAWAEVEEQVVS